MNRMQCAAGVLGLLLLAACNQDARPAVEAAELTPRPLAGIPSAAVQAPPRAAPAVEPSPAPADPETWRNQPATPPAPAETPQTTTPPNATPAPPGLSESQTEGAIPPGEETEEPLPVIPPKELAKFEKKALAEVRKQARKKPVPLKDFKFVGFDGTPGNLKDQVGQPLVVNFWAPWCPPCKMELPDFQDVYNAKPGRFKMIGVCGDESADPRGYVQRHGLNWTFVLDQEGSGHQAYEIQGIPRTLFIDRKGRIVIDWKLGLMPRKAFEAALAKITK